MGFVYTPYESPKEGFSRHWIYYLQFNPYEQESSVPSDPSQKGLDQKLLMGNPGLLDFEEKAFMVMDFLRQTYVSALPDTEVALYHLKKIPRSSDRISTEEMLPGPCYHLKKGTAMRLVMDSHGIDDLFFLQGTSLVHRPFSSEALQTIFRSEQ